MVRGGRKEKVEVCKRCAEEVAGMKEMGQKEMGSGGKQKGLVRVDMELGRVELATLSGRA